MMRIAWLPLSSMISKESTMADHTVIVAHVDVMVDRRRQIGAGQQPALLAHLDGDRAGADAGEDLPRQRVRHHAEGAASSTKAAVLAAASRSFSRLMRKLAIAGT